MNDAGNRKGSLLVLVLSDCNTDTPSFGAQYANDPVIFFRPEGLPSLVM